MTPGASVTGITRCLTGRQDGNILVYVIVVMLLFAALGTGLVSVYTTANLVSVIGDDARQAEYLAESGVRYATGELKKVYTRAAIQTLNDTTYTLTDGDTFEVNVFPKWFLADATVSLTTGETMDLNVPDKAEIPDGFTIDAGVYLVNINSLRDAIAFGGDQDLFIAQVAADSTDLDVDTLRVQVNPVGTTFEVGENQPVLMAVRPNATAYPSETVIPVDGSGDLLVGLDDPAIASSVFHQDGGTFYVLNPTTGVRRMYAYEKYTTASPVTLKTIRGNDALTIKQDRDLIIFSDKNHTISAQGRTGPATSQATGTAGRDMPLNTATAPVWAPETAEETPPDITIAGILAAAATPASTASAVEIDTANQEIRLGLGVGSAYSAVWYGGTQNVGGVSGNFCSAGKCRFEYGMRAYFTVDYNGTGDGFTFALMNGTDNTSASTGGTGGALGYAGTGSGGGMQPPKMALEFDTYTNTGQNDPGSSNKDYLNYVYWGVDDTSRNDDNTHDTWASIEALSSNIRNTPYVESGGNILTATTDGHLYRLNNRGEKSATFYLGASTDSSPIVDSANRIWIGTNDGYINIVNASLGSFYWYQYVSGNVRTIPAFDPATGWVFFGSDYTGTATPAYYQCNFCAFDTAVNFKWGFNSGDVIQGSPRIRGSYVYFGGNRSGGNIYKYTASTGAAATNWSSPYTTGSDVEVRPAVSSTGVVYAGSWENDRYFHAVNANKTVKWTYDTGLVRVFSAAALDETERHVYFGTAEVQGGGSIDGKVYALHMDTGALVWSYQTGGAIYSSPVVGTDGAVIIGSDDGFLYCFESDGTLRWQLDLTDDVRSSPALKGDNSAVYVGADTNRLYAVPVTGNPWQFKTWRDVISGTTYERYLTYGDNLPADAYTAGTIANADNWLNSGPWAVRVEVDRSQTPDTDGTYEYTVRAWIRQCDASPGDCSEITGTYFSDTRIAYEAKPAQMIQTFYLDAADHAKFETYYNGFTQATGGATQTITLRNIRIGFVRPDDFIVTNDTNWP
jgi:outer membrane protein assembly factor BamB